MKTSVEFRPARCVSYLSLRYWQAPRYLLDNFGTIKSAYTARDVFVVVVELPSVAHRQGLCL